MNFWYKELHPVKEGKRKFRYVTTCIHSLPLFGKTRNHPPCVMRCKQGLDRAWISNGRLYWNPGYAWNGCSPKYYIGYPPIGKWIGTPDFDSTLRPSLGHDILFQFATLHDITFDEANYYFLLWMESEGFRLAEQYYDAVDMFGDKFWGKDLDGLSVTKI